MSGSMPFPNEKISPLRVRVVRQGGLIRAIAEAPDMEPTCFAAIDEKLAERVPGVLHAWMAWLEQAIREVHSASGTEVERVVRCGPADLN